MIKKIIDAIDCGLGWIFWIVVFMFLIPFGFCCGFVNKLRKDQRR